MDLQHRSLADLIDEYGQEMAAGGAGYTHDDSDALRAEIGRRLAVIDEQSAALTRVEMLADDYNSADKINNRDLLRALGRED